MSKLAVEQRQFGGSLPGPGQAEGCMIRDGVGSANNEPVNDFLRRDTANASLPSGEAGLWP